VRSVAVRAVPHAAAGPTCGSPMGLALTSMVSTSIWAYAGHGRPRRIQIMHHDEVSHLTLRRPTSPTFRAHLRDGRYNIGGSPLDLRVHRGLVNPDRLHSGIGDHSSNRYEAEPLRRGVPFTRPLAIRGISFPCRGVNTADGPLYRVNSRTVARFRVGLGTFPR
jgi:hypothetical protein